MGPPGGAFQSLTLPSLNGHGLFLYFAHHNMKLPARLPACVSVPQRWVEERTAYVFIEYIPKVVCGDVRLPLRLSMYARGPQNPTTPSAVPTQQPIRTLGDPHTVSGAFWAEATREGFMQAS